MYAHTHTHTHTHTVSHMSIHTRTHAHRHRHGDTKRKFKEIQEQKLIACKENSHKLFQDKMVTSDPSLQPKKVSDVAVLIPALKRLSELG